MRYSIEPREKRFVKGYGFMSFARNFSDKYSKSLMDKGVDVSKTFAKTAGKKILKETARAIVIFKNCAPFTNCISEINNTQVDNAKDINIVMPMYNLIEYSDNYAKTSGSLWQYCKDIPARILIVKLLNLE